MGVSMKEYRANLDGRGKTFSIVISRFNEAISQKLLEGCLKGLTEKDVDEDKVSVYWVPGAFEIPMAAKKMVARNKYDAVICLGAVIRGDTPHFEYVSGEASKGIGTLALESPIPVLFGVLTTNNLEQAIERAGSKSGNKGWETALAAIEMVNLFKNI